MNVNFKRLSPLATCPVLATPGSACFDLHSTTRESIRAGHARTISTGLAFDIPTGFVMLVFSRSGHSKQGLRLANSVGVIDSDYRGEILVRIHNDSGVEKVLPANSRIAQAMLLPLPAVDLVEVDELGSTERGTGGFGSTGE